MTGGGRMWIATSRDAKADDNRSLFQLRLGSWPNREMQAASIDRSGKKPAGQNDLRAYFINTQLNL